MFIILNIHAVALCLLLLVALAEQSRESDEVYYIWVVLTFPHWHPYNVSQFIIIVPYSIIIYRDRMKKHPPGLKCPGQPVRPVNRKPRLRWWVARPVNPKPLHLHCLNVLLQTIMVSMPIRLIVPTTTSVRTESLLTKYTYIVFTHQLIYSNKF